MLNSRSFGTPDLKFKSLKANLGLYYCDVKYINKFEGREIITVPNKWDNAYKLNLLHTKQANPVCSRLAHLLYIYASICSLNASIRILFT